MDAPPLLKINNVSVTLGNVSILRQLTTSIPRQKITALIGLNGAGKTTLLRVLLKEIPYSGNIEYFCGHRHDQKYPQLIGYVPQRLQFDAQLPITVIELMSLALSQRPLFLGISTLIRQRIERMLKRVKSERLMHYNVGSLSGGELQRVLLALAMEPAPELLLLDEPAAGIDFQHQGEFYDLIDEINRETGVTVLLVSHDLSVISQRAHHVLCLKEGKIQCEGQPQDVLSVTMVSQIFGADKALYHHPH